MDWCKILQYSFVYIFIQYYVLIYAQNFVHRIGLDGKPNYNEIHIGD